MRAYMAFTRKECIEILRTYRALILLGIFFLVGMVSALTAKLTPEILKAMESQGFVITAPRPTAADAYAQLFKNISQMGLVAVVLVFCGSLSGEITRGTLVNLLSKGLTRSKVVLAKLTVSVCLWSVCLALAGGLNGVYTAYLFPGEGLPHVFFALMCMWVYGVFLLCLMLFAGAAVPGYFAGLGITVGAVGLMMLLSISPGIGRHMPLWLSTAGLSLAVGTQELKSALPALCVTLGGCAALVVGGIALFNRRRL